MNTNYQVITIDSLTIRQDSEGRYNINDLHKAAGGLEKDKPFHWLANQSAKALADELLKVGIPAVNSKAGRYGGTYVVKELVYAYAMWISPQFHLKVIRAYDRLATQGVAVHDNSIDDFKANPLKFMRVLLEQAETLEAELVLEKKRTAILAPKAQVFDAVVADKRINLTNFARSLPNVNTNAVKRCLKEAGYLYQHQGKYRVYAKFRDTHFVEKIHPEYQTYDIFPTTKGKQLIVALADAGVLLKKAKKQPCAI